MPSSFSCHHDTLCLAPSPHAQEAGYTRPTVQNRLAATTTSNAVAKKLQAAFSSEDHEASFPAPLVLPEDEISWDPKYPAQSLRSWVREKERNAVTEERKAIYVAPPPGNTDDVGFVQDWAIPEHGKQKRKSEKQIALPEFEDLMNYLRAFYYPLPVKRLPSSEHPTFASWDTKSRTKKNASYIALNSATESTRIRVRATSSYPFTHQLNLNDILDHAIAILPDDAYALLLVTEHDLFEGDDDDFCCGRAYGGSRIAVVSMARYNPTLVPVGEHEWPTSHCETFVKEACNIPYQPKPKKRAKIASSSSTTSSQLGPISAAVKAFAAAPSPSVQDVWLARLARTASHELGHCFALDHCVYYACVMQGTAGLKEDMRQPPYLCPVCESKVGSAVRTIDPDAGLQERYEAMLGFCDKWNGGLFAGFGAWIRARLEIMQTS